MIRPLPPERRFEAMLRDFRLRIQNLEDFIIPDPDVLAADLAAEGSAVATAAAVETLTGGFGGGGAGFAAGSGGFEFVQSFPAATWQITHNLGHNPSVQLTDLAGGILLGSTINYLTTMMLNVVWDAPITGKALCI